MNASITYNRPRPHDHNGLYFIITVTYPLLH